jgi:5'-nucleotidase
MRILVTNDDGIDAPGLHALRQVAETLGDDVWVVAPETNQSGAGHSLSLRVPLRMRKLEDQAFAVSGTPTDCVIMAVRHVMFENPPDLILSGINNGQNIAEDVTYSGTIAAAFEGAHLGIRSIALSQAYGFQGNRRTRWETAIAKAPGIIHTLLEQDWDPGTLMNVNFPDRAPEEVEGSLITRQGKRDQALLGIDERSDTWGTPYYWLGFARKLSRPPRDTDLWAIYNGYTSITPLSLNLTSAAMHEKLTASLDGKL